MDFLTLALAQKKALEAMGIKIEPSKVLTYDGKGETFAHNGHSYAKITSDAYDLTKVKSITVSLGGEYVTLSGDALAVSHDDEMGYDVLSATYMGMTLPAVIAVEGLSLCVYDDEIGYVTRIEFTETIHPIDPKYLPGVCLPVVEIADVTAITATESAAITAAAENGLPCVLKWFSDGDNGFVSVFNLLVDEGAYQYTAFVYGSIMTIVKNSESGLWELAT